MTEDDRSVAATAAALLRQGRLVNLLGTGLAVVGFAALLLLAAAAAEASTLAAMAVACVAGAVQVFFAVRVAFDAAIFERFAAGNPATIDPSAFDRALHAMGCAPGIGPDRPMAARARGALRLLMSQTIACGVEMLAMIVAAVVMLF